MLCYAMLYYTILVLTKQVDSTFGALWLVHDHQTLYILGYPPPEKIFKMAAHFATVTEEEIRQLNSCKHKNYLLGYN